MTRKIDIETALRKAFDRLPSKIDPSTRKDFILSLLFIKYFSDISAEKQKKSQEIHSTMGEQDFFIEEDCTFSALYQQRDHDDIGEKINEVLTKIQEQKGGDFIHVFRHIDFTSSVGFFDLEDRNRHLSYLLEVFYGFNLRPNHLESTKIMGEIFEFVISMFASQSGKSEGEIFTPSQVSTLLARLVAPEENDRIYDPTCGVGGLLSRVFDQIPSGNVSLYGQEINHQNVALCKLNLFFRGLEDATIWEGDTLSNPKNCQENHLMKFQCVVAHPPFGMERWDRDFLTRYSQKTGLDAEKMSPKLDKFHRFDVGVPPTSKSDYAFILHMLSSLDTEKGRIAVIFPLGVLLRGGSEAKIRKTLLEHNLLDAVIGLPTHLFYGTSIATCILVFRSNRKREDVLFIDASGKGNFEKTRNLNVLREEDINRIIDVYSSRKSVKKYSYLSTFQEIRDNEYTLNLPRYVDTFEEEPQVNLDVVKKEISSIEKELAEVQEKMSVLWKELGV